MLGLKSFMDELKVISRGKYYLTPFSEAHIDELCASLSPESRYELRCLGYSSIKEALIEMMNESESYVAKSEGGPILCVSGLFYDHSADDPQMFAMFTDGAKESFHMMARGSKMLTNFFDQTHPSMSMYILDKFPIMLNWAAWLGFQPVGLAIHNNNNYVEFVRCNPREKNVSHEGSRPVMH